MQWAIGMWASQPTQPSSCQLAFCQTVVPSYLCVYWIILASVQLWYVTMTFFVGTDSTFCVLDFKVLIWYKFAIVYQPIISSSSSSGSVKPGALHRWCKALHHPSMASPWSKTAFHYRHPPHNHHHHHNNDHFYLKIFAIIDKSDLLHGSVVTVELYITQSCQGGWTPERSSPPPPSS